MKICSTGDWHLRFATPESRIDDFLLTQFGKVKEIFKIALDNGCDVLTIPGDMWDNPKPSPIILSKYLSLFMEMSQKIKVFIVLGQHDMVMRSFQAVNRTPTYLFQCAEVLQIIGLNMKPVVIDKVAFHGLSWGQEYKPEPVKGCLNVLIAHAPVGLDENFEGYKSTLPKSFLSEHSGMDYINVGDYHSPFTDKSKDRIIFNGGCIVRKTKSIKDLELKPEIGIYDTKTKELKKVFLSILPVDVVYNSESLIKKAENPKLIEMIDALGNQKGVSASFEENLNRYIEANKPIPKVVKYLTDKLGEIHGFESTKKRK